MITQSETICLCMIENISVKLNLIAFEKNVINFVNTWTQNRAYLVVKNAKVRMCLKYWNNFLLYFFQPRFLNKTFEEVEEIQSEIHKRTLAVSTTKNFKDSKMQPWEIGSSLYRNIPNTWENLSTHFWW